MLAGIVVDVEEPDVDRQSPGPDADEQPALCQVI